MKLTIFLAAALTLILMPALGMAGISPRTALVESFTNVSCDGCSDANLITQQFVNDHDCHEVINLQYHLNAPSPFDPFYLVDGANQLGRAMYYSLMSAPSLRTAGDMTAPADYSALDAAVQSCRTTTSPLRVALTQQRNGLEMDVSVNVQAVGAVGDGDLKLRVAIVEEYVGITPAPGTNGETEFYWSMRRMLPDHQGTLLTIAEGQSLDFDLSTTLDAAWADTDLYAVAWIQNDDDRDVLQAATTAPAAPIALDFYAERWGAMVPVGEISRVDSWVENTGTLADTYDVHFSETMPGDWSLSACAGTICYLPFVRDFTMSLDPGESILLALDVTPLSGAATAYITMTVTSQTDPSVSYSRDFEATAPGADVLFVDADGGYPYETYFTNAITGAAATYSTWNRASLGFLEAADLSHFNVVVWNADLITPALTLGDREALSGFVAQQGDLLLSGQDIAFDLADPASPNWTPESQAWYEAITGASFGADDSHDSSLLGVSGDPIGSGRSFLIAGGTGANNQSYPDVLIPAANARAVMEYSPGNAGAIRFLLNGAHIVTLGFGFEGIDSDAARTSFMAAILAWFADDTPSAVGDLPTTLHLVSNPKGQPNPFNPSTEIVFELAGEGFDEVSVDIFDVHGRLVRTLWNGTLQAGPHALSWNGRDVNGATVASGTYLARVRAGEDIRSLKLILAK